MAVIRYGILASFHLPSVGAARRGPSKLPDVTYHYIMITMITDIILMQAATTSCCDSKDTSRRHLADIPLVVRKHPSFIQRSLASLNFNENHIDMDTQLTNIWSLTPHQEQKRQVEMHSLSRINNNNKKKTQRCYQVNEDGGNVNGEYD